MLLRIWTTGVNPEREQEYVSYARRRSRPMFLSQPGCLGVFFLRRSDGHHATCSLWSDATSVTALAQAPSYQHIAAGLAATGVLVGQPSIEVFEVKGGDVLPTLGSAVLASNGALLP